MHYYIDGYNLMFRVLRAGSSLEAQRLRIIADLNAKIQVLNLDVTLVFDSHHQIGEETRGHYGDLEICYTSEGETADDYILKRLKASNAPRQETVVTSDNRLSWRARGLLAKTESVNHFLTWLEKRYENRVGRPERKGLETGRTERPTAPPWESDMDRWLRIFEERLEENE